MRGNKIRTTGFGRFKGWKCNIICILLLLQIVFDPREVSLTYTQLQDISNSKVFVQKGGLSSAEHYSEIKCKILFAIASDKVLPDAIITKLLHGLRINVHAQSSQNIARNANAVHCHS